MTKIKIFFNDLIWTVKAYLAQPIVPTVSMDYVLKHNGSYTGNDPLEDDYVYYWVGDFKTGKEVKVPSFEVLRYEVMEEIY